MTNDLYAFLNIDAMRQGEVVPFVGISKFPIDDITSSNTTPVTLYSGTVKVCTKWAKAADNTSRALGVVTIITILPDKFFASLDTKELDNLVVVGSMSDFSCTGVYNCKFVAKNSGGK